MGPVAERIVVTVPLDPYLTIPALIAYTGLSERTLRELLDDPVNPLPHYRTGGRVTVRRSEWDLYAAQFHRIGQDVEQKIERLRDREKQTRRRTAAPACRSNTSPRPRKPPKKMYSTAGGQLQAFMRFIVITGFKEVTRHHLNLTGWTEAKELLETLVENWRPQGRRRKAATTLLESLDQEANAPVKEIVA
jgi:hypothetical protein